MAMIEEKIKHPHAKHEAKNKDKTPADVIRKDRKSKASSAKPAKQSKGKAA